MKKSSHPSFDFISIGETLIDLISCDEVDTLLDADCFQRFVGGQPTNLARNMALLGNNTALGACVGDDFFGHYIREQLAMMGVHTEFIQTTNNAPTSAVPVTRTQGGTPGFMIYRGADSFIEPQANLLDAVAHARAIHTSAFALSREPARSTILKAFKTAHKKKACISLDPNYHPSIWPDIPNFISVLRKAYRFVDITKPSLDDCLRIFATELHPREYARRFLEWGAKIVVITLGSEGVFLATATGDQYTLYANEINVTDVTGAGDAFWAGFINATLEGKPPIEAARLGQALAETKIETVGPLQQAPDRGRLEEKAQRIEYRKQP